MLKVTELSGGRVNTRLLKASGGGGGGCNSGSALRHCCHMDVQGQFGR